MNRHFLSKLKRWLDPALDPRGSTGPLSEAQHRTLFSLLVVLAADEGASPTALRDHLDREASSRPGLLGEIVAGLSLLETATRRRHPGRAFHDLSFEDRDQVLHSILRAYPHPFRGPAWRRRGKVTAENLDILSAGRRARRFRLFVARELLAHYYTTAAGWAVVGYRAYPGRSRAELEPCEVRSTTVEGEQMILALSDGSFEALDPRTLRLEGDDRLSVLVKAGRQKALFSRAAYMALSEHLEDAEEGYVLRTGGRAHEVLR
jgi:hypothetical protein